MKWTCLPDVQYPPDSKLQTQDIAYSLGGGELNRYTDSPEFQNFINTKDNEEGIQC